MKQFIAVILSCISIMFFNGCGDGEQKAIDIRTENRQNILKINVGMTKAEILQIMGDKTAHVKKEETVTNPYKSELRQANERTYEVLYYYTHDDQPHWPFKRFTILDRELTPIIFQDGKVIGWGSEFLAQTSPDKAATK
jgi:Icc-related predicted phosphoesterase